jgi:hypothetical protein
MWALYSGTLAFWTPVPSARGVHSRIPLYPDQGGGLRPVVLGCRMSPISPIRRHQVLVNCAFSFCWDAWFHDNPAPQQPAAPRPGPSRGERGAARRRPPASALMAAGAARDTRLAFPWIALQRWWPAWSTAPPPPQLQALINSVAAGCGLHLYIPN